MTFEEDNEILRRYHHGEPMSKEESFVKALNSFRLNIHCGICNNCKHHKKCEAPKYPPVYECVYYKGE